MSEEAKADLITHSRQVWGANEKQRPILKGFQSELGGRLAGATRGSSYANQLDLVYNERYGSAQDVWDALFKRHFDWRQLVPVAVFAAVAVLYYSHPGDFDQAGGWLQVNWAFALIIVGLLGVAARSVLTRRSKK